VAAHQKKKEYLHEYYRNNQDEHHRPQKLVENDEQLGNAEEAKLNKLAAAHQKKEIMIVSTKETIKMSVIGIRSL
jgi:hypothetical protein